MKKMIKVYVALAAIATLAFGLFSCSGGGNDVNPLALYSPLTPLNSPTLKYLDLSNAKSLYISGGSGTSANKADGISASASGPDHKKIFKITDAGYVEEVKYLNGEKKEISILYEPCAIDKINDDYIFIGFGNNLLNISSGYLVRKSDGAAFDMKNAGMPRDRMSGKNANIFSKDKKKSIYYLSIRNSKSHPSGIITELIKINLENIDLLSSQVVSASTDYVTGFDVDANGNLIYTCNLISDNMQYFTRIRKNNGGIKNITDRAGAYWIGLDGYIYYYGNYQNEGIPLKKISIDNEYNISETVYGFLPSSISGYKLELKNRIIMIDSGGSCSICEVYNPSANPRNISLTGLTLKSVTAVNSTENFYYIAGTDNSSNTILIKVNPEDDSWTNLLPDNNYEVYTFTASETDGITFNALRMSDGKKIIGKVGINGGAVTVIDEESNAQISYLERIN